MESKFTNYTISLYERSNCRVMLLVHKISSQAVAVKVVDLKKHRDAADCVKREERLHRLLVHPNIIRLFGKREEQDKVYIFLEYAAGGELFNKIEPDIGMPCKEAQLYMKQLMAAVSYLHLKGIAHRDIKPENILLDETGIVKISDFGMATVFRLRGKQRKLEKRCGTMPYLAPEVLQGPYAAEPADIWSCGIVFVAMLAGELPWDEPTENSLEFVTWQNEPRLLSTPWSKLDTIALSLARKILTVEPSNRPTIDQILNHPWMRTNFNNSRVETIDCDNECSAKRHISPEIDDVDLQIMALSQPASVTTAPDNLKSLLQNSTDLKPMCFSQPTHNDDLILGSQTKLTQSYVTLSTFHKLVKRLTRFFVKTSYEDTITTLCRALDHFRYTWNIDPSGVITISTMDRRKLKLVIKANLIHMDSKLLLDFRLSKGCGLEFKRRFVKLKDALKEITI
ncbi:protein kinase [Oryctes borbonicus]|uniref:non-specific serine/threonine protein kinase n=1 Tax=Oryctes borbonicus TaxID=1629725 RepID=A0A0T6B3N0_9SCAR|nr:protein kinase [Oryctes borbonicus]